MKANRLLFTFMIASGATFVAFCYLGIYYESVVMHCANWLIQALDINARLVQSADRHLFMITGLQGTPAQFKIDGFNWVYASQATVVGVVLSTISSAVRKAAWMGVAVSIMAVAHTLLLVFLVAELLGNYVGEEVDIAAYGIIVFKLYRVVTPLLLAGIWIICSRDALFVRIDVRQDALSGAPAAKSKEPRRMTSPAIDIPNVWHAYPKWALQKSPTK